MLTESDIVEALRACYTSAHPYRRPIDIVDLGMVVSIMLTLDDDAPGAAITGVPAKYRLTLTLLAPSSDDDTHAQLQAQIANRLAGIEQLSHTFIHFVAFPQWTTDRVTPEARRRLNLDFPILNNR